MKVLLGSQDVWDIIENEYQELVENEIQMVEQITILKKARVRDKTTLYFLYNALDLIGFEKIVNVTSSKEAWEIPKVTYKGDNHIRQVRLQGL